MATWCFDKDAARGYCSSAVTSSMYRSLTFSSGPIAFGSLLQGIAKVLRSVLSHSNRSQRRGHHLVYDAGDDCRCCCFGLCGIVLECLSEFFGDVLDYFSQWAYCFVGINGTSYLQSGKSAIILFKTRGWMALITDRLVALVLGFGIFESGVVTGLATIVLERIVTWSMYQDYHPDLPSSYVFGSPTNLYWTSFLWVIVSSSCWLWLHLFHRRAWPLFLLSIKLRLYGWMHRVWHHDECPPRCSQHANCLLGRVSRELQKQSQKVGGSNDNRLVLRLSRNADPFHPLLGTWRSDRFRQWIWCHHHHE